jgi:hypothetical protein
MATARLPCRGGGGSHERAAGAGSKHSPRRPACCQLLLQLAGQDNWQWWPPSAAQLCRLQAMHDTMLSSICSAPRETAGNQRRVQYFWAVLMQRQQSSSRGVAIPAVQPGTYVRSGAWSIPLGGRDFPVPLGSYGPKRKEQAHTLSHARTIRSRQRTSQASHPQPCARGGLP